jgi:hypothetical protein
MASQSGQMLEPPGLAEAGLTSCLDSFQTA